MVFSSYLRHCKVEGVNCLGIYRTMIRTSKKCPMCWDRSYDHSPRTFELNKEAILKMLLPRVVRTSESIAGRLTHITSKKKSECIMSEGFRLNHKNDETSMPYKPDAVWISWSGGWEEFCELEGYGDDKDNTILRVTLKKGLKLWFIDSMEKFLIIWNQFDSTSNPSIYSIIRQKRNFWKWLRDDLGFDGVALTKKGEEETRSNTFLYGWDCRCLAIFDPNNVIFEVEKRKYMHFPKRR